MRLTEVLKPEPGALSAGFLVGQRLGEIDRSALPYWRACFDGGTCLVAATLWRFIENGRVRVTSEDHGHRFGLPEPVDAYARLEESVGNRAVSSAAIDARTGDLKIGFGPEMSLEVLSTSCGYENWTLHNVDGSQLIALGGGRVGLFRATD